MPGELCYSRSVAERDAIQRMLRGFRAAEKKQRELMRAEGPAPEQAVAEAIAAADALAEQGTWPGPRDPVNERAVERVRSLWARIGRNAKQAIQA